MSPSSTDFSLWILGAPISRGDQTEPRSPSTSERAKIKFMSREYGALRACGTVAVSPIAVQPTTCGERYNLWMIRNAAGEPGQRVQLCKRDCTTDELNLSSIFCATSKKCPPLPEFSG
jgi:hypothetical protein